MTNTDNTVNFTAIFLMVVVIIVFLFVYLLIYKRLKMYTQKTDNKWDDFVLDTFKIPLLWILIWIMIKSFAHLFLKDLIFFSYLIHANNISDTIGGLDTDKNCKIGQILIA